MEMLTVLVRMTLLAALAIFTIQHCQHCHTTTPPQLATLTPLLAAAQAPAALPGRVTTAPGVALKGRL